MKFQDSSSVLCSFNIALNEAASGHLNSLLGVLLCFGGRIKEEAALELELVLFLESRKRCISVSPKKERENEREKERKKERAKRLLL